MCKRKRDNNASSSLTFFDQNETEQPECYCVDLSTHVFTAFRFALLLWPETRQGGVLWLVYPVPIPAAGPGGLGRGQDGHPNPMEPGLARAVGGAGHTPHTTALKLVLLPRLRRRSTGPLVVVDLVQHSRDFVWHLALLLAQVYHGCTSLSESG